MQNRNEKHNFKPIPVERFKQLSDELFIENKIKTNKEKNSLSLPNLTSGTILDMPTILPQDEDTLAALVEQTVEGLTQKLDHLDKKIAYQIASKFQPYLLQDLMDYSQHISIDSNIAFGKPCIVNTRISVEFILELLALNWTIEDVLEEYPQLTHEHVQAAIDFARKRIHNDYSQE